MKKLTIIFYVIFLLLFSFFSYAFIDQNLPYLHNVYSGFAFSNRLLTAAIYILSIIIFFIFYGIFIFLGVKKMINLKEIIILLCVTVVALFFSYPAMLSYDIFNYLATSKVLFLYHENPYVIMPIELTAEPLLSFMHAANKIALYGPFWILLTGIPYFFGMGNFIITLFAFKLLVLIFYLSSVFLIWKMSKNILAVILFAFNPLIVIETLISGHNDMIMVFLALFSFYLLTKKRILIAILLLILSILIKYATVLLFPIFFYAAWEIIKKKEINWKIIFYLSSLAMFVGFLLSPLREEMYPWYAVWFLSFVFLIPGKKILAYASISLSFGLLFRYVAYIFSGTYAGFTPLFKSIVTFTPIVLVLFYFIYKKLWEKKSFR